MRSFLLQLILLACLPALPQDNDPAIFQTTRGEASFISDAPLEIIKASSNELNGLLNAEERTFAFSMKTRSFKGFNSPLQQEHFYENYIESNLYPNARFSGKIIEPVNLLEPGEHSVRAKGILEIHGVERERVIRVDLTVEDRKITAKSNFEVLLEDHNITIPKMVFQKISEQIRVEVDLEFSPKQ